MYGLISFIFFSSTAFSQQKMMLISKSMSRMSLVNPTGSGKDDDDLPAVPPPNLKNRGRRPSSAGSSPMPKFRSKSQCSPRKVQDTLDMCTCISTDIYMYMYIHMYMYICTVDNVSYSLVIKYEKF